MARASDAHAKDREGAGLQPGSLGLPGVTVEAFPSMWADLRLCSQEDRGIPRPCGMQSTDFVQAPSTVAEALSIKLVHFRIRQKSSP